MSSPIPYDLELGQGSTYRDELQIGIGHLDEATGEWVIDVPDDFTGCAGRMQIRKKYGSPVLLEVTTVPSALGSITLGGNTVALWLSDEGTDGLVDAETGKVVTTARYDLEVEYPSGDVDRVLEGQVTVSPNITRDSA